MFQKGLAAQKEHKEGISLAELMPSMKQNIPASDEMTLGGNVNFDKFQKILNSITTPGTQ